MLASLGEDSKMAKFFCVAIIYLKPTVAVLYLFFVDLLEVYVARLRYASTLKLEAADFSETLLPIKVHIRYQKTIMSLC